MDNAILTLREYLQCHQNIQPTDVMIILGSADTRVAIKAAELYKEGYSSLCMTTGKGTTIRTDVKTLEGTEADIFADIMIKNGVPADKIIRENRSTNTGENILYAYEKIKDREISSLLIVQKPYMERRALASFEAQRPDKQTQFFVTSPHMTIEEYCNGYCDKEYIINMMVGDLQRIIEYPKLGFQSYQEVPNNVLQAYQLLIDQGFTKQLMKQF